MANHAVVRLDRMTGTDVCADLRSVRFMGANGETPTAIDNGNVVELVKIEDAEREVWVAKTPTANSAKENIVLVATPEKMYDINRYDLAAFENAAGAVARGYIMHQNDVFSVTAEALDGTAEKDKYVVLQAGTKLKIANAATGAIGKIVAVETAGRFTYYVIRVL